jgi:hypothetical protein
MVLAITARTGVRMEGQDASDGSQMLKKQITS